MVIKSEAIALSVGSFKFHAVCCRITPQNLVTDLLMIAAIRHLSVHLSFLFSTDSCSASFLKITVRIHTCFRIAMPSFLRAAPSLEIFLMERGIFCRSRSKTHHPN